jgi:hypothetical protein
MGPLGSYGGSIGPLASRAPRNEQVAKRYDEPIEVTTDPADHGAPLAFSWRGRRYEIDQRLESWLEAGDWWSYNGRAGMPPDREYHRVLARPAGVMATGDIDADGFMRSAGAVYDVYRDPARDGWRLARVWD